MSNPTIKKRRTFFSSSTLSLLPTIPSSSSSKTPIVSRDKILAPLLDADQQRASTPPLDRAIRRRNKSRLSEDSTATATSPKGNASNENTPPKEGISLTRPTRSKSTRVLNNEKAGRSKLSTTKVLALGRKTSVTSASRQQRGKLRPASNALASRRKAIKGTRTAVPKTPPLQRSAKGSASQAQSSNERLATLMQTAMRATVGGRTEPYQRVPVWMEPEPDIKSVPIGSEGLRFKPKRLLQHGRPIKGLAKPKQRAVKLADKPQKHEEQEDEKILEVLPAKKRPVKTKEFMTSGFYCQDANPASPFKLVNRVLDQTPLKTVAKRRGKGKAKERITFPPMPYYEGEKMFMEEENEFILPFHIHAEVQSGILDQKKKPTPYQKLRSNIYPNRSRVVAGFKAICKCDSIAACGDNCINRATNYLCGKDCPAGDACQNRSLAKRTQAMTRVFYTGSRGFGLMAMEDIKADSFVTDYRGEVISLDDFKDRIADEYAGHKNFYALSYSRDEVIDAGMRGNDARFINHGCDPNLEVRKCQNLGDGLEEYEIGMWATRDIAKGEELFYNYNFDDFGAREDPRTPCHCGAATCFGFLGRRSGDKTAREIRQEVVAEASRKAASAVRKTKRAVGKKGPKKLGRETSRVTVQQAVAKARTKVIKQAKVRVVRSQKATLSSVPDAASVAEKTPRSSLELTLPPHDDNVHDSDMAEEGEPELPTASSSSGPLPVTPGGHSDSGSQTTSSAKRKSGWANWLMKKAAEKTRTLEEWHEERIKRRRGTSWMNMMISEFGIAPTPDGAPPTVESYSGGRKPAGSKGSFANSLAAQGLGPGPDGVRNLGGPAHAYKKEKWGQGRSQSSPGSKSVDILIPKRKRGRPSKADIAAREALLAAAMVSGGCDDEGPVDFASPAPATHVEDLVTDEVRETEKSKAIKKRNGAPMGWVLVPPGEDPATFGAPKASRLVSSVELNLDRSARRGRASMP